MKEIEVKILEVNPEKLRDILRNKKAKLVMPKNLQGNYFYVNKEIDKKGVIRLRTNNLGNTIAFKSKVKFSKGHKVMNEHETKVDNMKEVIDGLEMLGLKQIGCVEVIREDWKFYNCLISLVKMPRIPYYVEIEGSEKDILKVAKMLGYSEEDYYPEMIYGKYKIKTKFLRFEK
jgi:predicted adenylyl cyclase CyaB